MLLASTAADRSLAAFPAGSNGEFNLPPELATVIRSGQGCRLKTADGREFLDFSMGWGSVLIGHADPRIARAVASQLPFGSNFAYVNESSLALAEELIRLSPACEAVRFCASGTEATMYCLRLARAFTGRRRVLRFEGAYHGAHDVGVTSLFPHQPPAFPTADPSSAGITAHHEGGVLVAPFNDLETTAEIIERYASELAAVIVEPLQRCLPPAAGFLAGLREVCDANDVLLAFDEVVTGFRLAYGGAQEKYGVVPDLVAYGKALGGGMPIGAFGGRADIMELVREDRLGAEDDYVWTASTLGGNPLSCSAALACLEILRGDGVYEQLYALGDYLRQQMRHMLKSHGVTAQVLGDGPLAQIALVASEPHDYRTSQHKTPKLARKIMLELFRRGVFLNPMGTKLYLSLAHTSAACDEFCGLLSDTLADVLVDD